jgi:hypothetical protein
MLNASIFCLVDEANRLLIPVRGPIDFLPHFPILDFHAVPFFYFPTILADTPKKRPANMTNKLFLIFD